MAWASQVLLARSLFGDADEFSSIKKIFDRSASTDRSFVRRVNDVKRELNAQENEKLSRKGGGEELGFNGLRSREAPGRRALQDSCD